MRPWTNKSVGLGISGLVLIVVGVSLCFFWPVIFQMILQKGLSLSPTSKSFKYWSDTSDLPPMHLDFYFFNWTNPEEIKEPGKKPILVEVGPYSFVEVKQKVNITFHPHNSTVSYFQRRFWSFDPERSNGTLKDNITQLNAVAVSAAHKTRYWSFFIQQTLSYLLSTASHIHIVKTVDELLFAGYEDTIIKMGKMAPTSDDVPPFDRFGWFYMRNGSTDFDGHYNMDTGEDDISKLGNLRTWNYRDTTKFYKSPCNVIEGSAGEFWPPHRTPDEITLFSADLCRPVVYEFSQKVTHLGVEGYQYTMGEKTLGNNTRRRYPHEQAKFFEPTTTTEDFFAAEHSAEVTDPPLEEDPDVVNMGKCYCNGECSPAGLVNITVCRYGAPAFVSLPHFNKADPMLRDQVIGMDPDDEKHSFSITLEPNTGIPMDVAARLQVNILLQPSKIASIFKTVPKIYFPMFWFSMRVKINEDMASDLRLLLSIPNMCVYGGVTTVTIGSFIVSTVALLHIMSRQRKHAPGIKPESVNTSSEKKAELLYLDKMAVNEDGHVRSDRRLYPKLGHS